VSSDIEEIFDILCRLIFHRLETLRQLALPFDDHQYLTLQISGEPLKRPPVGAISSVGRALRLHRRCRRFEPVIAHHFLSEIVMFSGFAVRFTKCSTGSPNLHGHESAAIPYPLIGSRRWWQRAAGICGLGCRKLYCSRLHYYNTGVWEEWAALRHTRTAAYRAATPQGKRR
jgi:hypothetical protein